MSPRVPSIILVMKPQLKSHKIEGGVILGNQFSCLDRRGHYKELTTYSGMALVGTLLAKTELYKRLSQTRLGGVIAPELSQGDIAISYLSLLCQGKSDFDCIEEFRKDKFFRQALRIYRTPSSPTLRQRLDAGATHPGLVEYCC